MIRVPWVFHSKFTNNTLRKALLCVLALGMLGALNGKAIAGSAPAPERQASWSDMVPLSVQQGTAQVVGPHSPTDKLLVLFMLPFRDKAGLESFLADVGNPQSPQFNRYLSLDEANARFNPDPAREARVMGWLRANGVTDVKGTPNHLFVQSRMDTTTAQNLLGVKINDYQTGTKTFYAPDRAATLPAAVSGDVTWITGLDDSTVYSYQSQRQSLRRSTAGPARARTTPASPLQSGLCPAAFAEAYNVNPLLAGGFDGKGITVAVTLWTTAPSDATLQAWADPSGTNCAGATAPTRANGRLVETFVEGTPSADTGDGEAALDIESIGGLAGGTTVHYFEVTQPNNGNLAVALNAAGTDPTIQIISNSWGGPETSNGVTTLDPVLQSNSATGHVYVFSSGDNGSWAKSPGCAGNGLGNDPGPMYPASSQYVLSVGGTRFINDITTGGGWPGERTWDYNPTGSTNSCTNGTAPEGSGGGYSQITSRPPWQVVSGLAANGKRGYPDVAADADPGSGALICGDADGCFNVGGTSLAAPLWSAMLAITNQKLKADGFPYFSQPGQTLYRLYATSAGRAAFHDITSGTNGSYNATSNWDAVTGLGSPNLNLLIPALENLPPVTATPTRPPATATRTPTVQPSATGTRGPTVRPSATGTRTPTVRPSVTATRTPIVRPSGTPQATSVPGQVFNDVPPSNSFYSQINWANAQGIIGGYACGSPEPCPGLYFRPGNNASRGQVAKMLVLAAGQGSEAPGDQIFNDVDPSSPFYTYVQIAAHHSWVGGYSDGTYRPGALVTRGQFSKMVSNAANFQDAIPDGQQTFQDVDPASPFWVYVERVVLHGVANGYVCNSAPDIPCAQPANLPWFRVGAPITRGQLAKMISRSFGGP